MKRILLVESNKTYREVLKESLESRGFDVKPVKDREEAIKELMEQKYTAVVARHYFGLGRKIQEYPGTELYRHSFPGIIGNDNENPKVIRNHFSCEKYKPLEEQTDPIEIDLSFLDSSEISDLVLRP